MLGGERTKLQLAHIKLYPSGSGRLVLIGETAMLRS